MKRELTIATCQFPVRANIQKNESYILKLLQESKAKGADIAHFSESSLSGYAGIDFKRYQDQDDGQLKRSLEKIRGFLSNLKMWAIVGGHHFEGNTDKPYNCLWVINDQGEIVERYDKRFCYGHPGEHEHNYYTPGQKLVQFKIKDIVCGVLICHEWRYPELYREQKKRGTEILFQSWYDGNLSSMAYQKEGQETGSLITGTVKGNAANNYLWISASNTSQRESCFASFVARPDGRIFHQLKRNVTGALISNIDLNTSFEDPSGPWRDRASNGILHNAY